MVTSANSLKYSRGCSARTMLPSYGWPRYMASVLIRHEPPTDEEMMRAKNTIAGGYVIDLQRRAARASLLAQDEVSGLGYEEALGYLDRIRTVTAGEVRDVAARWFQLQSTTLTILKPPAA